MRSTDRSDRPTAPVETQSPSQQTNLKRRGFLLTLGIGSAGAAAIAASSLTTAVPDTGASSDEASGGAGYQMSDHIRRYYRTAKI